MANPYRSEAKTTGASKFKSITGRTGGGSAHDNEREGSDGMVKAMQNAKQMPEGGSAKPGGQKVGNRLDKYARGGRAKKGNNVTINIVSPGSPSGPTPDIGAGGPLPPVGPPPGAGLPPPGPPMMPPPGDPGPGPGPGGPPPMMRKDGGRIPTKADGGSVGHKYPQIEHGTLSGKGRQDKIKAYGLKPAKKG